MSDLLEGGCHCGSVRYEITAEPFVVFHCHCRICRQSAAAPFMTWIGLDVAGARITHGEVKNFSSSDDGRRGFCPSCGGQISFVFASDPETIYLTASTLDDPNAVTPSCHGFTDETVRWLHIDDDLPQYVGNPPVVDERMTWA